MTMCVHQLATLGEGQSAQNYQAGQEVDLLQKLQMTIPLTVSTLRAGEGLVRVGGLLWKGRGGQRSALGLDLQGRFEPDLHFGKENGGKEDKKE